MSHQEHDQVMSVGLQALACLEADDNDVDIARQLFRRGTDLHPQHLHLWQVSPCLRVASSTGVLKLCFNFRSEFHYNAHVCAHANIVTKCRKVWQTGACGSSCVLGIN